MTTTDDEAFNQFVIRWKKKLRGIAYKTAGEQQHDSALWLRSCSTSRFRGRTYCLGRGVAIGSSGSRSN